MLEREVWPRIPKVERDLRTMPPETTSDTPNDETKRFTWRTQIVILSRFRQFVPKRGAAHLRPTPLQVLTHVN